MILTDLEQENRVSFKHKVSPHIHSTAHTALHTFMHTYNSKAKCISQMQSLFLQSPSLACDITELGPEELSFVTN